MADSDFVTSSSPQRERIMPQNIEAERAVLAAMILSPDVMQELLLKVKDPNVFYRPAHQKIFQALVELYDRGTNIDQVTLADRLQARGELEQVGGKPYIIELANNSFALANWSNHADIVIRCSILRELIAASTQVTALAYDAPDDLDQVVGDAEKAIFKVTEKRLSSNFLSTRQMIMDTFTMLDDMAANQSHLRGVPTGFTDLDELLYGLRPGSLTIIAARPGVGKTSLALNIAVNAAKAGVWVAMFSLEMSSAEIMPRILASEACVNFKKMRSGHLDDSDWTNITAAADPLMNLKLWIDDTPALNILEMKAKARRQLHNRGDAEGLIIVDYLQLMTAPGRRPDNRQVEIAEISRGLKVLAKEMGVPVIALSQLSRGVESRTDKRPMLSDLRESGAIEQDADIVMFIDRSTSPAEAEKEGRPPLGLAKLIVAKNRSGPIADIPLTYLPHFTRFMSYASENQAQ